MIACALLLSCSTEETVISTESKQPPTPIVIKLEAITASTCIPNPDSIITKEPPTETLVDDIPTYDRDEWNHWIDSDKDCQNTRHEILQTESLISVTFKDNEKWQVASGEWDDSYTGEIITDATEIDIDHMVPLKNAHDSDEWPWDKRQKI